MLNNGIQVSQPAITGATAAALALKIDLTEKGAVNGVATLDGSSKIPTAQLPTQLMEFLGNWDASTNTPTLANTDTDKQGNAYRCSVAGTVNFGAGAIIFGIGDWVYNNGTTWDKGDNTEDQTLADVLTIGNTTGGNNIVMPFGDVITEAAGGATLNVAANALGGTYDLTTDSGGYAESWVYGDNAYSQIGFNWGVGPTISLYAGGWDVNSAQSGDKSGTYINNGQMVQGDDVSAAAPLLGTTFKIQENSITLASSTAGPNQALFLGTGNGAASTVAIGLDNTVVASGRGITAKTGDTLYTNKMSLQANGNAFDTMLTPSAATADRTVTIQDASGTVAYLSNVPSKLYAGITDIATVDGLDNDLDTYTIAANTLGTDGTYISFDCFGSFAANANSKSVNLLFGGVSVYDSTQQIQNSGDWRLSGTIIRTSVGTQKVVLSAQFSDAVTLYPDEIIYSETTSSLGLSNIIKCVGNGVAAGDIIQKGMIITYNP